MIMRNYQKLDVYKVSMNLVKSIYLLTKSYPREEMYILTSQTKRAAISIPLNIAEGLGRQYKKDTIQFLHVARGSVYELETVLQLAVMTEIIRESLLTQIWPILNDTLRLLNGLIKYLEKAELK
jgi:four helix bundle protein